MWKIGDKAVCIADCFTKQKGQENFPTPVKNQILTVTRVAQMLDAEFLCFKEMSKWSAFSSSSFRKLSEVSGELSEEILTEVLTSIEEPVEV